MIQVGLFDQLTMTQKPISWFNEILQVARYSSWASLPDAFGTALRNHFNQQNHVFPKTLSLFSGGLDIAFQDAGFEILHSVEIERTFAETLEKNTGPGQWFEHATVHRAYFRKVVRVSSLEKRSQYSEMRSFRYSLKSL